jgi:hypothetical protein
MSLSTAVSPTCQRSGCRERGGFGGRSSCTRWSIDFSGPALAARHCDNAVVVEHSVFEKAELTVRDSADMQHGNRS